MTGNKSVLYIMTARGGSKGVPRKNIIPIGEHPLLAYKLISARKTQFNHRIIISTDDKEIANIAVKYGAEAPFIRPAKLSGDTVDSMLVVEHAVKWVIENDNRTYDYICLLEPTSPFVSYLDLNKAIDSLIKSDANAIESVVEVDATKRFIHPLDKEGRLSYLNDELIKMDSLRRQDQETEYTLNGGIYCTKWNYFLQYKTMFSKDAIPYIMPKEQSVDINNMFDVSIARMIVEKELIDLSLWR